MAKDFAEIDRAYFEAGIQGTEVGTKDVLVNKFVKAWENQTARRAVKGGTGLTMALTLAACGGSGDGGAATTPVAADPVAPVDPISDLTVGIDTLSFAGVLNAVRDYTPGGNDLVNTLQSGDTITGTGDADVMNVVLGNPNDSADALITPLITGVETVNISSVADNALTVNLASSTGLEVVSITTADADLFVALNDTDIAVTVRDIDAFNGATNVGFIYTSAAVDGAADVVNLTVDGVNGGVDIDLGDANQDGIETVNLAGVGASSDINQLLSNDVETLVVTGAVTLSGLSSTVLTTLDTSGATGDTEINIGANLGNAGFTYVGGDSNDTIIASAAFVGTASLDAGLGTDTLAIRSATDNTVGTLDAAGDPVAAGFEVLSLRSLDDAADAAAADFTVDMDILPGVTSVAMDARDVNGVAEFTLNDLSVAQAGALSLDLSNEAAASATVISDIKTDTAADAVVLDVEFAGEGGQTATLVTNATTESATINISGSALGEIDTVDADAAGSDSLTVTGGLSGATLVMADTYAQETIDASGVASDMDLVLGVADQTVTTGTGDDIVTIGDNLTNDDTIDLGDGENTLVITDDSADRVDLYTGTDATAMVAAISNVDILEVSNQLASDIDVDRFGGVQNVVLAAGATTAEISSLASTGASVTIGKDGFDAGNVTSLTLSIDNATLAGNNSDELTVAFDGDGETVGTLVLAGVDTLNIASAGGPNVITTLTATALDSVVVTGDEALTITSALIDTVQVVDASAATGDVTISVADGGTTGVTMTGGEAVDTFTGGDGDDIINGNDGADVLVGGAGDDAITGGAGADNITGGAGADTIDLTELVAAADVVVFAAAGDGSAVGTVGGTFSGFDVVTNFSTSDQIDVIGMVTGTQTVVAQNAAVNNLNDLADADFTDVDAVVAFMNDGGVTAAAGETSVVAVTFSDFTALYAIANDGTAAVVEGELTLLATVDDILVAADYV